MMSVPSTTERLSGEASTSIGKQRGRAEVRVEVELLADAPAGRAPGAAPAAASSHLGPPTAPKRIACAAWQSSRVAGGSGLPGGVDGGAAHRAPARTRRRRPPTWRPRAARADRLGGHLLARFRHRAAPRSCTCSCGLRSPWAVRGESIARPCSAPARRWPPPASGRRRAAGPGPRTRSRRRPGTGRPRAWWPRS